MRRFAYVTQLVLLGVSACLAQNDKDLTPQPRDVVEAMMPNGVPTELVLPGASGKAKAIAQLKKAQVGAEGLRAQQVAFLLAVLGADYEENRALLVAALERCNARPMQDCDENTAAFVIGLSQRGDPSLLAPLLRVGPKSDGALSEILGDFYADTLIHSPKQFLLSVRSLTPSAQQEVCYLAGGRDGGGMSEEELQKVSKDTSALVDVGAQRCLRAVAKAVRQARGANAQ